MDSMATLDEFSTCDVADAMDKLGIKPGFIDVVMRSDGKVVGPAYTVKFVDKHDSTSPRPQQHHVDAIPDGEGVVVVISAPKDARNAVWGGLMSTRAHVLGAKGVVVDGI